MLPVVSSSSLPHRNKNHHVPRTRKIPLTRHRTTPLWTRNHGRRQWCLRIPERCCTENAQDHCHDWPWLGTCIRLCNRWKTCPSSMLGRDVSGKENVLGERRCGCPVP